jgi:hypothetical protein
MKGIWKGIPEDNNFFFDPYQQQDMSDFDAMFHLQIWENGVQCEDYSGNIWIITEISCHVSHDMFPFANGQSFTSEGRIHWSFSVREVGVVYPSSAEYTITLPENLNNKLTEWLKNLTL